MPILTSPPDASALATRPHVAAERSGDGSAVGTAAPPPEELLPSGGTDRRGTATGPDRMRVEPREAALDQALIDALFRAEVEHIRRQLEPVRSRLALASSYGREAARRLREAHGPAVTEAVSPLQVAYALRWLELADRRPRIAAWAELVDGPLD